jgi:outer membrane porin, OprD family
VKKASTAVLALSISTLGAMAQADSVSQEFVPVSLSTTSAQADAKGFLEDSHLSGSTKNFFAKEQQQRGGEFHYQKDGGTASTPNRNTWTQGTIIDYASGFTQGRIGFAVEGAVYNEVALEQGRARIAGGSNRTLTDHNGEAVDQWSKLGIGNVKARVSNTVFTAGRQSINTPVVAYIGNRALPSSFEGFSLKSDEFDTLSLQAGTFDRVSPRTEQSQTKFVSEYSANRTQTSDRISMAGADWTPSKALTVSIYGSNVEDFWNQYYLRIAHDLGDSSVLALNTDFNYYNTKDSGSSKMGKIDNNTYSLAFTLSHMAHSLTLAYQEVNSNEFFDYVHETNAIFLSNSLLSDFNGPNEKSVQIGYGLNMAEYGVPGLKFSVYSARGFDIDGTRYKGTAYDVTNMNGEKHQEYGLGTSYTLQDGALKGSSVKASYTTHRATANQADGNIRELRIVTTIPFKFF